MYIYTHIHVCIDMYLYIYIYVHIYTELIVNIIHSYQRSKYGHKSIVGFCFQIGC